MLLKVWESISNMWCQKSLVAPTQCVLLTWSPVAQRSWLTLRHTPSDLYLSIPTTLRVKSALSRDDPDTHSARCQAQAPRPQPILKKLSSVH